jgi:hypothetical protein
LVLSHGRTLYCGPGGFAPVEHMTKVAPGVVMAYTQGYNVADYLLDVASDPPVALFQRRLSSAESLVREAGVTAVPEEPADAAEKGEGVNRVPTSASVGVGKRRWFAGTPYAATFLTQLQVLSGRELKILSRYDVVCFLSRRF